MHVESTDSHPLFTFFLFRNHDQEEACLPARPSNALIFPWFFFLVAVPPAHALTHSLMHIDVEDFFLVDSCTAPAPD